jgi:hypothetical protein
MTVTNDGVQNKNLFRVFSAANIKSEIVGTKFSGNLCTVTIRASIDDSGLNEFNALSPDAIERIEKLNQRNIDLYSKLESLQKSLSSSPTPQLSVVIPELKQTANDIRINHSRLSNTSDYYSNRISERQYNSAMAMHICDVMMSNLPILINYRPQYKEDIKIQETFDGEKFIVNIQLRNRGDYPSYRLYLNQYDWYADDLFSTRRDDPDPGRWITPRFKHDRTPNRRVNALQDSYIPLVRVSLDDQVVELPLTSRAAFYKAKDFRDKDLLNGREDAVIRLILDKNELDRIDDIAFETTVVKEDGLLDRKKRDAYEASYIEHESKVDELIKTHGGLVY